MLIQHLPKCGARRRGTDKLCQLPTMSGRRRCRLHGGLTPRGDASPHFKHGRYSKSSFYRAVYRDLYPLRDPLPAIGIPVDGKFIRRCTRRCMALTKAGTRCRQWAFGPTTNFLPRCFAPRWLTADELFEQMFGRRRKPKVGYSRHTCKNRT